MPFIQPLNHSVIPIQIKYFIYPLIDTYSLIDLISHIFNNLPPLIFPGKKNDNISYLVLYRELEINGTGGSARVPVTKNLPPMFPRESATPAADSPEGVAKELRLQIDMTTMRIEIKTKVRYV